MIRDIIMMSGAVGISARYWGITQANSSKICQIEFFTQAGSATVSTIDTNSKNSGVTSAGFVTATEFTDSDFSTREVIEEYTTDADIIYWDLSSSMAVSHFRVAWDRRGDVSNVTLYYSDDASTWTATTAMSLGTQTSDRNFTDSNYVEIAF